MDYVIKGNLCYSDRPKRLWTLENGYLVVAGGTYAGAFSELPDEYRGSPITDWGDRLILPGFSDLHLARAAVCLPWAWDGSGTD